MSESSIAIDPIIYDQPFVEKKEDGFDFTMPLHESTGVGIGTVGDRLQAGTVVQIEKRVTTKTQLFQVVK